MFYKVLGRLRGVPKEAAASPKSPTFQDALHPMREMIRTKALTDQQSRLKKSGRANSAKGKSANMVSPARAISPVESLPQSAIFDDGFMKRLQSQSLSYTPDWLVIAGRRSTTVNDYVGDDLSDEEFQERLADYAEENTANEEELFSKLTSPDSSRKVRILSDSNATQLRAPNPSVSAVTPEAVRAHLEQNWNNLSLARARNASAQLTLSRGNSLGVRGRNLSNWRSLSASRARGVSSSVQSMHRENSLSISIALVSFQYALRRSTAVAPPDDDGFQAKLEEFAAEHERVQKEQWKALENLTPNVGSSVYNQKL